VVSKFGIQKRKYSKGWHTSESKNYASLNQNKTTKTKITDVKPSNKMM